MTEQEETAYLKRLDTRTKDLKRWMENGIPLEQIDEETDLRNLEETLLPGGPG